jgi:hypothetical protein
MMKFLLPLSLLLLPFSSQAQDTLARRIILIGDAGELHQDHHNPVIDAVKNRFDLQDPRNTVLYLGDNVYPYGMPDPTDARYPLSKEILDYQVNLVRNTNTRAYFIPGNHDWKKSQPEGLQTVINEQLYIDSLNLPNVSFEPKDGCPGPIEVSLDKNVTLVIMDSEWWLFPYYKPGPESSCDFKTRQDVLTELSDIVIRNRNKLLIFAAHHPFRSYGVHGGYYTLKQHIFPLTDLKKGLYIPLPVIGSIYPITRGVFGTPEDLPNPDYQELVKGVEAAFKPHGPAIFVSGHEHSLQFIKDQLNYYIVSGSGAKETRVRKGAKSLFASNENGYAALEISKNGNITVQYYTVDKTDTPAYASALFNINDIRSEQEANASPTAKELPPFVTMPADTQYIHKTGIHDWLLGDNYRKTWATPINFPVMDIHKEKGGLKILKRGGGMQTLSLRLEDAEGREWVLRSVKKFPDKAIPAELKNTIAKDVVQDQISASNPYATLAVAKLAEAAGVPHTNPTFIYLPKDTALGVYASTHGDDVYLFEEREAVTKGKTYNTVKVLEQIHGDNDNTIDQEATARARMLDLVMADWDRHDDQWRWGVKKHKKRDTKEFYPIPRDRDQAFFVNQGVLTAVAARKWLMPKFQGFKPYYPNIEYQNPSAQPFDRSFMNEIDEQKWKQISHELVLSLPDSVIKAAIARYPDTVQKQVGDFTIRTLIARRDKLEKASLDFYRFLSKNVDVTGSKKDELFSIDRQADGMVAVNVNKISKKGEVQQNIYSRTFDPKDTKEIRIYGLGGEDKWKITGDHSTPIHIRIIGGKDNDTYIDSTSQRAGNHIRIYEKTNGQDTFQLAGNERRILSSNPANIAYERTPLVYIYDKLMPLATAGFNSDDGLSLGAGFQFTHQGFRKRPFASRQTVMLGHSLGTKAWMLRYTGEFTDFIGNTDLVLSAAAKAPNNTINFFGYGNETVFEKARKIRYYRTRFSLYNVEPLLKTKLSSKFQLLYGPTFTYYTLDKDETQDRIISDFAHNGLDSAAIFQSKSYAGLKLGYQIDTRNNIIAPTRGFFWNTTLHANQGLNGDQRHYLHLQTDMSIYTTFRALSDLTLVTRFGGGKLWGHYEFFQAMYLGGVQNLRGYRNYRFAGDAMAFNNTELRIKLFNFRSYLFPATVGLMAFNDVGRVWKKGEQSSRWHDGYGGGVFFSPMNALVLTATVGRSDEEVLPYITFGFRF